MESIENLVTEEQDGNFALGLINGVLLSTVLWISFFGWLKIICHLV